MSVSEDTPGDGIVDVLYEEENKMPESKCDLPETVATLILQESAGAHSAVMTESKTNAVFQNGLLRTIAAKKFDELGASESRNDVTARGNE